MKHNIRLSLASLLLLTAACNPSRKVSQRELPSPGISINGKLFASMFQQRAAEYKALCYQAFNVARLRLDMYRPVSSKPLAIVTDIDETILDNSPYAVQQTLQGKDYDPESWYRWTDQGIADTVPGSATFLKYAASKGIEIFYVTNRVERERRSTLNNLRRFDLPNADSLHFLGKQNISSKEVRRQTVIQKFEIVLFLGDNLGDFSSLFDKQPDKDDRMANTKAAAASFGERFILLPNTVYGDWEGSLYKFKRLTESQKDSVIRSEMKGFK